ncbi:MAG: HEAT repeat domain-containing protein, partial [Anaerolineae bacterium]|nr:HEAT repeat domain-containing protein [Anaerolineae bacterium]
MITKQHLEELKSKKLDGLYAFLRTNRDQRDLLFILENLGHLPAFFDGDVLLPFVHHPSAGVRFWAVKNLGKLESPKYFNVLVEIAQKDNDSMVRREAVSSIGRMRLPQSQSVLFEMLSDNDPKVVLQAIRGLLVFKEDPAVRAELFKLTAHPNEMVQSVIRRELLNGRITRTSIPHPVSPSFMQDTVVQGDVREVLKLVPDESIHL